MVTALPFCKRSTAGLVPSAIHFVWNAERPLQIVAIVPAVRGRLAPADVAMRSLLIVGWCTIQPGIAYPVTGWSVADVDSVKNSRSLTGTPAVAVAWRNAFKAWRLPRIYSTRFTGFVRKNLASRSPNPISCDSPRQPPPFQSCTPMPILWDFLRWACGCPESG